MNRSPVHDASSGEFVTIGRVVKAHGIRGEVAVHPLTDLDERFAPGAKVKIGDLDACVVASRPHQGRLLVRFEHVADRSAAERLRGAEIKAAPLPLEEYEHFFAHELVGLAVHDADGEDLGSVSALIELPEAACYDLLEVARADGTTWLLPASDELVEIELDADGDGPDLDGAGQHRMRLVVTNAPEGLIEGEADVARPDGPTDQGA